MKNKLNVSNHIKLFLLVGITFVVVLSAMATSAATAVAIPNRLNQPSPPTVLNNSLPAENASNGLANCRYGVNALFTDINFDQVEIVPELGSGWYVTFDENLPSVEPTNGAEFVHMIQVHQEKDVNGNYLYAYTTDPPLNASFGAYIANQKPGTIWIFGNEIERKGQGEIHADLYAEAYHNAYNFIKAHNPTALVANSALVQYTPNRMQYLDLMWQAYQDKYGTNMPIDVWTMHLYILPEVEQDGITPNNIASVALGTNPALGKRVSDGTPTFCANNDIYCFSEHDNMTIFAEQVRTLRQWMKTNGQQNKPLLLTEFSVLYPYILDPGSCFLQDENGNCFTPQRVSAFMQNSFNYLNNAQDPDIGYPLDNNRLVQAWAWFSIYNAGVGEASNLYTENLTTQTMVGTTMANHVWNEPTYKDLIVESADSAIVFTGDNATATAELTTSFRNNGNVAIESPFKVTFYADANLTQPIGEVTISADLAGCAVKNLTASVNWDDLEPGVYPYWVYLDSGDNIPEATGTNNVKKGLVVVDPKQTMLPAVFSK